MDKRKILLADDDQDILRVGEILLGNEYKIKTADSVYKAKSILNKDREIDLVVADLNFEGQEEDGLHLIDYAQNRDKPIPVVVLSNDNNTKRVVDTMRRDLIDFVPKQGDYEKLLCLAIETGIDKIEAKESKPNFLTKSPKMLKLLRDINRVLDSSSQSPILLLGESGCGKEIVAKYCAEQLNKKLVAANMAALPNDMVEAELFGYQKGAFTGAHKDKAGLIEVANHNVFFLDEIGDCPPKVQAKLLRVIQEKEVMRLGSNSPKKVNVRFMAATHQDLDQLIEEKRFRLDLKQRLSTFVFNIPPLRERQEDIAYYTNLFVNEFSTNSNKVISIEPSGLDALMNHSWPGNIRALRNAIERIVVCTESGKIDKDSVENALSHASSNEISSPTAIKFAPRRDELLECLNRNKGNKRKTATEFNISRPTLYRWMRKLGLNEIENWGPDA